MWKVGHTLVCAELSSSYRDTQWRPTRGLSCPVPKSHSVQLNLLSFRYKVRWALFNASTLSPLLPEPQVKDLHSGIVNAGAGGPLGWPRAGLTHGRAQKQDKLINTNVQGVGRQPGGCEEEQKNPQIASSVPLHLSFIHFCKLQKLYRSFVTSTPCSKALNTVNSPACAPLSPSYARWPTSTSIARGHVLPPLLLALTNAFEYRIHAS